MIGSIFKRRANAAADLPKNIRIVGQYQGGWTVTDADAFGSTMLMHADELARNYHAPPSVSIEVDEDAMRAPTAVQLRAVMGGYRGGYIANDAPADDSQTPEAIFARIALEEALAVPEDC
jgi:hypothetical protein